MRKGIIMEKHRWYAIVMSNDGNFHKAKPIPGCEIGEEVQFVPVQEKDWRSILSFLTVKPNVKFVALITAFLLAILPLYTWVDSQKAYAYVNIDINPSIEMKVNSKMKVINIIPLNEEASLIVESLTDWKNQTVEKVTVKIIKKSEDEGYMNENKNVIIGVSYKDGYEDDKRITESIDHYLAKQALEISVATFEVAKEIYDKAAKEKTSMNSLFAAQLTNSKEVEESEESTTSTIKAEELNDKEREIVQAFFKEAENRDLPPGLQKKVDDETQLPPGLEKKREKDSQLPPGLEKKREKDSQLPPGLEKKGEKGSQLPPGLEKKRQEEHPGNGRDKREKLSSDHSDHLPPGLQKKNNSGDKIFLPNGKPHPKGNKGTGSNGEKADNQGYEDDNQDRKGKKNHKSD